MSSAHPFQGLHHVQLAMPGGEEDSAREFFGGVLGMTEPDKPTVLAAHGRCLVPRRRLQDAGQDVTWDGDFPGFRRVYAHDPFGNRLEFLQPV